MCNRSHIPSLFEHRPGDDGLGMLTPLDENHGLVPVGTQTRIILHLREDCNRAERRQEFLDLPDTLLLFLKNLGQLSINIKLPGYPQHHTTYRLESHNANTGDLENRVFIEKRDGQSVTRHHFLEERAERLATCRFTKLARTTLQLKSFLLFLLTRMRLPSVSLNLYTHSFPYETKTSRSVISLNEQY